MEADASLRQLFPSQGSVVVGSEGCGLTYPQEKRTLYTQQAVVVRPRHDLPGAELSQQQSAETDAMTVINWQSNCPT